MSVDSEVLLLLYLAVNFIVAHEYSHLANSHLEYLNTQRAMAEAADVDPFTSQVLDLESYALELDADCGALTFTIARLLTQCADIKLGRSAYLNPFFSESSLRVLGSERLIARYFGVALRLAFEVLLRDLSSPFGGRTHPASRIRGQWCMTLVMDHAREGRTPREFSHWCFHGWYHAFIFAHKGRGITPPYSDAEEIHRVAGGPLAARMYAKWASIRPSLKLMQRGNREPARATVWGENWLMVSSVDMCQDCEGLIDAVRTTPHPSCLVKMLDDVAGASVYRCRNCGTVWQVLTE
ncbi:hypothetical protein [Ramlibacter pallidus]|uniref:Peptidase M48 domain-containing protein n=1 Tax=Ramlibacter pallidus TaxID=2780087 RepID=A0ABR9S7Z2_9BURK|nr:hypothetical protein [Ramlibacter pallidus]MBE7369539.1 hypothetical protein [Ramlibacter pallidus]